MNKVEEAREALDRLTWYATYDEDEQAVLMEAADAYALAAHVDACGVLGGKLARTDIGWDSQVCGDGWYCDKGLAIGGKQ